MNYWSVIETLTCAIIFLAGMLAVGSCLTFFIISITLKNKGYKAVFYGRKAPFQKRVVGDFFTWQGIVIFVIVLLVSNIL